MLEQIKLALRITTDDFDEQINNCINFVKEDLRTLGANIYDSSDIRIIQLTTLYAKEVFDWENKGDWYAQKYEQLRNQITLQGEYQYEE